MKRFIFITSIVLGSLITSAQTESEIRNHYNEVNQQIKKSLTDGYEGPFYHNQWITNKNGTSWPAVGMYEAVTDFWYTYPPDIIDENENPSSVLLKVTVMNRSTSYRSEEEYLFQNGHLVFFYSRLDEGGDILELSYYFDSKGNSLSEIIRYNEKELVKNDTLLEPYKDVIILPEKIILTGKKLQDMFLVSM